MVSNSLIHQMLSNILTYPCIGWHADLPLCCLIGWLYGWCVFLWLVVCFSDLQDVVCYSTYKVMSNTLTYLLLTNTLTLCVVSLTYQVMSDTLKLTVHFLTRWSGSRRFAPTRFHQPISEKNTSSFLMLKTENKIILNIHVHVHCTY